ncbi:LptA/OstA family protein [Chelativorans sp. M5D2P16]|uniref:LptA/OstA family protein n=1 Tax=Chelativorans sp. M5D2P16 TaxID=3095678 RepID=UPI002ACA111D|nr:LptA/OstA family protein [Chelativorans sp. M5D2P16]MDZ5697199.1 LptA/OstA family protein [Chelativorans sp. M5D2P16]
MNRLRYLLAAAVALLAASAALAQGQGGRQTGLKLSGDQPIQIESDRFEVNESEGVGVFTGNVSVVQGETQLRSARMKVFYDSESGSVSAGGAQIERLEVDGGVYLKSEGQVATGERGTFNMQTEVLELSGNEVVLTEGENVIVGCKLTVQMASGQATLESCKDGGSGGRVRMLLTPDSQNRQ